jgi:hypothetical protein
VQSVEEIMAKEFLLIIWLASNHDNYPWSAMIINHARTNFSHANFNSSHISFHVFM